MTDKDLIKVLAREWLVRQHSGRWSNADASELEAWLNDSAAHQQAYQRIQAVWNAFDRVPAGTLTAHADALKRLQDAKGQRWTRRRLSAWGTVAASLCALLILVSPWSSETYYQTEHGAHRTVVLPDGSNIDLNTDTVISVAFNDHKRHVTLHRGEAFFTVTHDSKRPFEVSTPQGQIRDIGTAFNVRMLADRVAVAVSDGSVDVALNSATKQSLQAGEQIALLPGDRFSQVSPANAVSLTAWRHGKIVFHRTPLAEVFAEMSRYHPVEFRLSDPAIRAVLLSGTFSTNELPVFLRTLEATLPISAEPVDNRTIAIKAKDAHQP